MGPSTLTSCINYSGPGLPPLQQASINLIAEWHLSNTARCSCIIPFLRTLYSDPTLWLILEECRCPEGCSNTGLSHLYKASNPGIVLCNTNKSYLLCSAVMYCLP